MRTARVVTVTIILCVGMLRMGGWCTLDIPSAVAQPAPAATPAAGEQPAPAAGNEPAPAEEAVIPPGQEELLADMLGRGAELPGPCKFAGAQAEQTIIRSRYTCPAGEVVFELRHPGRAAAGATLTSQFALMVQSGSPPDGFAAALATRIRSKEAAFEWKWLGRPASRFSLPVILLAVAGALALAALGWALRRRAARRRQPH